jgi:hypothetical protein
MKEFVCINRKVLIDSNNNYEEKKRNNVIKISLNCQYANVINFCKTYKRNLDNLLNLFPITEGKATKLQLFPPSVAHG